MPSSPEIFENMLTSTLERIMNMDDQSLESYVRYGMETKQRMLSYRNMKLKIYPNDHIPPHFHVESNDKSIDARFYIENGKYWDGVITPRDARRIEAFYNTQEAKKVFMSMWNKYRGT